MALIIPALFSRPPPSIKVHYLPDGGWRRVSYTGALEAVERIASALLELGSSAL